MSPKHLALPPLLRVLCVHLCFGFGRFRSVLAVGILLATSIVYDWNSKFIERPLKKRRTPPPPKAFNHRRQSLHALNIQHPQNIASQRMHKVRKARLGGPLPLKKERKEQTRLRRFRCSTSTVRWFYWLARLGFGCWRCYFIAIFSYLVSLM